MVLRSWVSHQIYTPEWPRQPIHQGVPPNLCTRVPPKIYTPECPPKSIHQSLVEQTGQIPNRFVGKHCLVYRLVRLGPKSIHYTRAGPDFGLFSQAFFAWCIDSCLVYRLLSWCIDAWVSPKSLYTRAVWKKAWCIDFVVYRSWVSPKIYTPVWPVQPIHQGLAQNLYTRAAPATYTPGCLPKSTRQSGPEKN